MCCSFGFVGSVKRCPGFCEFQRVGPNGASAVDGVASIFAHEISEIISDPDATAWYACPPCRICYLCAGHLTALLMAMRPLLALRKGRSKAAFARSEKPTALLAMPTTS